MARHSAVSHSDQIAQAVSAGAAARSPVVASWSRSARLHHLEPERELQPHRVEEGELLRHRDKLGHLLLAAQESLDHVSRLVAHAGCSVVIADREGIVLERRSLASDEAMFRDWGLWVGADWSERSQGTNAIGTALVEDRPVVIHRDQHFLQRNTVLSCMTAPIHDEYGELSAVIDVTTCKGEFSEDMARMICAIATDAAHRIEKVNFSAAFATCRILTLPEDAGKPPVLLAIDKHDMVVGATRAARQIFSLQRARDINVPAPDLLGADGADRDTFEDAERGVILRALQKNDNNMSRTAKALGMSRATLYRKLSQP
ncbi:GAF domain-containing protein [Aestuariivirga sp.]|uniref:GAF domain-containing protein n=1 Tax=Aestuariivirga sp. TaxID=2650926 RepID=UPI0039E69B3D